VAAAALFAPARCTFQLAGRCSREAEHPLLDNQCCAASLSWPLPQLLVHPVVRQRTAVVAAALEYATLPILLLPVKPAGADFASLLAAAQSGGRGWVECTCGQ